ncbi:MAG: hypothetical protein MUE56_10295, partial [Ignavibacteria bacterium]|nr:hypothetical protein [Ignavibacteria bacterium]
MENFILIKQKNPDYQIIVNLVNKYFPGSTGIRKEFGEYTLFLFNKGLRFPENFVEGGGCFVAAYGTPVYKGLSYTAGLQKILNDFFIGNFDQRDLYGHYYIFISNGTDLKSFNDGSGVLSVYYDVSKICFCSSFLILAGITAQTTFNKDAILENLLTGGIIGDETIINEIKTVTTGTRKLFDTISITRPEIINQERSRNRKEAVEQQI